MKRINRTIVLGLSIFVCLICGACSTASGNSNDKISKMTTNEEIAEGIVNYFAEFPEEREVTTLFALSEVYGEMESSEKGMALGKRIITGDDLFDIHSKVFEYAEDAGIELDNSKNEKLLLGLPYSIPYIVIPNK